MAQFTTNEREAYNELRIMIEGLIDSIKKGEIKTTDDENRERLGDKAFRILTSLNKFHNAADAAGRHRG